MNSKLCIHSLQPLSFINLPVVGLTGGIGSGKSQVSERLQQHGIPIIDTDCIAHELTGVNGNAIPTIAKTFGHQALNSDGSLNRTYMRGLIFEQAEHKKTLENILHPAIRKNVIEQLQNILAAPIKTAAYIVIVVPLLFESNTWQQAFKHIVVVDCTPEEQIQRVLKRNGWPLAQIHAVLAEQASRETRLAGAHHVISNRETLADLIHKTDALHAKLSLIFNKP